MSDDIFKKFRHIIKKILYDAVECEFNYNFAMYEGENSFKKSISDIYLDTKKFKKISEVIFDDYIYPMLCKNKFGMNNQEYIDLKEIYKAIPETNSILKELRLELQSGEYDNELGSIVPEIDDLSKFKITLFVNAVCYVMLDKEFSSIRSLTNVELQRFKLGFIRVLIHELDHLQNYFLKSRETVLKDFVKQYSFSNFERSAFFQEFMFEFMQENGVDLILKLNEDEFLERVKSLRCWKTGLELDYFGKNVKLFDKFLLDMYKFFRRKYRKNLSEHKVPYKFLHKIITTVEDIRNIQIPQDIIDEISQVPDLDDDESET